MSTRQKIESILIVCVAAALQWFFMFTKHDPGLRPVIPFGDDPYDALGSFATIVNLVLCPLLLWRAFRPYRGQSPSLLQVQSFRRTQAAVPLLILVTLAADAVAMLRHPQMWTGVSSQNKLLASFAGMVVISGAALWLIRASSTRRYASHGGGGRMSLSVVSALFLLVLAVYPERWINRLSTHLLTVLIGDVLLFAPVSVFLLFLFPDPRNSEEQHAKLPRHSRYLWTGALLAGVLIGAWLFFAEVTEGGGPLPPARLRLLVASVYVGLTIAGLLIALAFLQRPLGLDRRVEAAHSPDRSTADIMRN